jgi:hypothetical protein
MATSVVQLDRRHFVDEPSIIVLKEGDITYALNAKTKSIITSSTDAVAVIQKAIDSLPATGGKIFIKAGEYVIHSSINLKSFVVLEGEGADITTLKIYDTISNPADGSMLNRVAIKNMTIDAENRTVDALVMRNPVECLIERVFFRRIGGTAIRFENVRPAHGYWNVIEKCLIDAKNRCIDIKGSDSNFISKNVIYGGQIGLRINDGYNIITDNDFLKNVVGIMEEVALNQIIANRFDHIKRHAIYAVPYMCGRTIIKGNQFRRISEESDGLYPAVWINPQSAEVGAYYIVEGNHFSNAPLGGTKPGYCIAEGANANDNIIIGNVCESYATDALYIVGTRDIVEHNIPKEYNFTKIVEGSVPVDSTGIKSVTLYFSKPYPPGVTPRASLTLRSPTVTDFEVGGVWYTIDNTRINVNVKVTVASATQGALVNVTAIVKAN